MYKLFVLDDSGNLACWKNFINDLNTTCHSNGDLISYYDTINLQLKKYNAFNPGNQFPYIEFGSEEDATMFVLRWS